MVYLFTMDYSTTSINDVLSRDFQSVKDKRGELKFFEIHKVFNILACRIFFIQTVGSSLRGGHAHRLCNQVIICNFGSVSIKCFDSVNIKKYELNDKNFALFIPCGIWVDIQFHGPALITVLCDQPYIEEEYIRDIDAYNVEKKIL